MSNTPSSPIVQRVQQSAPLFVVVILALGALILAATNIDPNSAVRGNIKYTQWNSPNNEISLAYPAAWTPISQSGLVFMPDPKDGQRRAHITFVVETVPAGQDTNTTMAKILSDVTSSLKPDAPPETESTLVGGLRGVLNNWTTSQPDPTNAAGTVTLFNNLWIAPLDDTHFVVSELQTSNPIADIALWAHTMSTLHVNPELVLKALGVTPTPVATSAATASGTEAATASATEQGTASVAPVATQAATQAVKP